MVKPAEVAASGLSYAEAERRLSQFGLNQIAKPKEVRFFSIMREEISEPMILLLLVVGFFYTLWGNLGDALTILVVIFLLVFVEVWNEYRAKKAISALSKLSAPVSKVFRDGSVVEVDSSRIVPGDILVLSSGTRIAADAKLFLSYSLQVDESSLIGESFPVDKKPGEEIYAGTLVVSGEGKAEVFSTGENTRIGKIATLAKAIKPPKTPLQLSMKSLAKKLVSVAVFFSIFIPAVGFLRGQDIRVMVLTGLSLAFATIPEELPIIITMVLGLGAYKLSKKRLLIKKLKAAEALGNASVIVTDKTGTITENRMSIVSYYPNDEEKIISTARSALSGIPSSPMDNVILETASNRGLSSAGQIVRERVFSDDRKSRSVIRQTKSNFELFMSGAPEEVLALVGNARAAVEIELEKETAKGRRVIAIARRPIEAGDVDRPFRELERDLVFVGLISFEDPPRAGVMDTVVAVKRAGVRTIMVTGDHPKTAAFIASEVGITANDVLSGHQLDDISENELQRVVKSTSVFARTSPEHKFRIVNALQKNGEVVAVTGDGINDTLALKEADIGIAMGVRGTDAAKEAADIVVADDNFVTIGSGLFVGRIFFDNLRKGVRYYLSVKAALVLVFLLPILIGIPFFFAPIQIIVLELFMDLAASSAFIAEPAEKTIYSRPPRKAKEKFLDNRMVKGILLSGFSLFLAVSAAYFYASYLGLSQAVAQSYAFCAWIVGHIILAFISRSDSDPLYSLGLLSNRVMNYWAVIVVFFLALAYGVPVITEHLKLSPISLGQMVSVLVIALLILSWQEALKVFNSYRRSSKL
jgi:Ca2+-transporting ATPase